MSSEYQLRKDVDRVKSDIYRITDDTGEVLNVVSKDELRSLVLDFVYDIEYIDATLPRYDEILDMVYPVGSIYMSVNPTSPSVLFGGVWEQLKDRFLLARGDTYPLLDDNDDEVLTGGESEHTLSIDEMPSHNHENYVRTKFNFSGSTYASAGNSSSSDSSVSSTTIKNTGGGQAHNNMPPYLVVYMWKRIEEVLDDTE